MLSRYINVGSITKRNTVVSIYCSQSTGDKLAVQSFVTIQMDQDIAASTNHT